MNQKRRAKLVRAAMNASFVGAVMAGCGLGLAAQAGADDNCDPLLMSMTPQPVLACQPAPDVAPPPDQPAVAPVPPPAEPGPFGLAEVPTPALPDGSAG
jgi:hypothetical protein